MLRQQGIFPSLEFLLLLNQASGTFQFPLTDLLDVNLIRSLNKLCQSDTNHQNNKRHVHRLGEGYASQPKTRPRTDPGTHLPLQRLGLRGRRLEGPSKARRTSGFAWAHLELFTVTTHKPSQFLSPSMRPSPGVYRFEAQRSEPTAWPPQCLPLTWRYQRQRCLQQGKPREGK